MMNDLKIPQHVAVIMDGNGRWATERNLPRSAGHKAGADRITTLLEAAKKFAIPYITVYAFSQSGVSILGLNPFNHLFQGISLKSKISAAPLADDTHVTSETRNLEQIGGAGVLFLHKKNVSDVEFKR